MSLKYEENSDAKIHIIIYQNHDILTWINKFILAFPETPFFMLRCQTYWFINDVFTSNCKINYSYLRDTFSKYIPASVSVCSPVNKSALKCLNHVGYNITRFTGMTLDVWLSETSSIKHLTNDGLTWYILFVSSQHFCHRKGLMWLG